jgi:hypothetical protein
MKKGIEILNYFYAECMDRCSCGNEIIGIAIIDNNKVKVCDRIDKNDLVYAKCPICGKKTKNGNLVESICDWNIEIRKEKGNDYER